MPPDTRQVDVQHHHGERNPAPACGATPQEPVRATDGREIRGGEAKLQQDEQELRRIIDLIPQTIVVLNPDGKAIYANRVALEYTGLSLDEVRADEFRDRVFHPEDVQRLREERQKALSGTAPFENEQRARGKDGKYRWFLIRYNPLLDENGKVLRWYATGTEIEHRKQAENKLRQEGSELRQLIDFLPQHVLVLDKAGTLLQVNKTMLDYKGFTFEEMKGGGTRERINRDVHPDDLERVQNERSEGLSRGVPFETEKRLLGKDGQFRWFLFRYNPVLNEAGDVVRWFATATDIEDRKQAEERIRQREAELRQILDLTPQVVGVYGPGGERLYANRFGLEYMGVGLEDWRQAHISDRYWLHPDERERIGARMDDPSTAGVPLVYEHRLRKSDGSYRWFLARYNPLRDEEGRITRWYVVSTDIEDRKQAEERLQQENVALREEVDKASMFEEIVGSSQVLREVLAEVSQVAPTDSTVLILGETGTGKELIARAIHNRSKRANRAFVPVNCAAVPPALMASELFGHEKGAFTGAQQRRLGRFESADGGTIFLDEVGELPPEAQIALLRVLQEREFERVGGNQTISVDVRVLAATNRDLKAAADGGRFRQDLFYRLNVFPVRLPALRERLDDIPLLVEYLIDRYAQKAGKKIRKISKQTLDLFKAYDWPGNIRELQNVVERAVILCDEETFRVDESWLRPRAHRLVSSAMPIVTLADSERAAIENALRETEGVLSGPAGAAVKLGVPRQTLEYRLRKLGINRHQFKPS